MRALLIVMLLAVTARAAPTHKAAKVLVLVLDRSGSMQGPKLEAAREAALTAIEGLTSRDAVSIIVFDSEATVLLPPTRTTDKKAIAEAMTHLTSGGGTNIFTGLESAFEVLGDVKALKKHVIVLSDGESPSDGITELVTKMHDAKITLSAVGVQGADRELLQLISTGGAGRLYMVEDLTNLPTVFLKETRVALR